MRRIRLFATIAALLLVAAPASATNAKRRAHLTATIRALVAERTSVERELNRQQESLANVRTRRDEAEVQFRAAAQALNRRLVSIYRSPPTSGIAQVLVNQVGDSETKLAIQQTIVAHDQRVLAQYRAAVAGRAATERELIVRGSELQSAADELDVRRLDLTARLRALPKPAAPPAPPSVSQYPGSYTPQATLGPVNRGLPIEVLSGRLLPGGLSLDPLTGRPVLIAPSTRSRQAAAAPTQG